MFRRLVGICLLSTVLAVAIPNVVSAHVLKTDGNIGAVLHINPDDNPKPGVPADYVMSFSDTSGSFSLPECDCRVSIIENGQTIDTKKLNDSSQMVSNNHYTFTKPAIYTMRFTGEPKKSDAFQPFTLDYEVRVAGTQANQPMPVALWVGMAMAIGLILLAAFTMEDDKYKEER